MLKRIYTRVHAPACVKARLLGLLCFAKQVTGYTLQVTDSRGVATNYKLKTKNLMRGTLLTLTLALVLFALVSVFGNTPNASAATSSYLNFQGRLLTNTGTVVPDGNYHIEYKIYDTIGSGASAQGVCSLDSSTDDCLWIETRTTGNLVRVVNGYFSVNLGSVTAFGATIPWDRQLYLTMRIGGTGGAASWDPEMLSSGNRMTLTGVPYAFRAGQLASFNGTQTGTLSFGAVTNSPVLTLPNETGTICSTGSVCTGYAPSTLGTGYIQNGTSTQTANFNIQSAASGSITAVISGASGQTVNILQVNTFGGAQLLALSNDGSLTIQRQTAFETALSIFQAGDTQSRTSIYGSGGLEFGSGSAARDLKLLRSGVGTLQVAGNGANPTTLQVRGTASQSTTDLFQIQTSTPTTVFSVGATGAVLSKNSTDSTTAFQVQNAAGANVATVDSTIGKLTIAQVSNYSDDFNSGGPTAASRWALTTPDSSSYTVNSGVAGKLRITANPNTSVHECWDTVSSCLRFMQTPPTGDFTAEIKLDSLPPSGIGVDTSEGIIVWKDTSNFIRFELQTRSNATPTYRVVAHKVIAGVGTSVLIPSNNITSPSAPIYVRVNRTGNVWTLYYSTDGSSFTNTGNFTQALDVSTGGSGIGPYMGNSSGTAFTNADYDYFHLDTANSQVLSARGSAVFQNIYDSTTAFQIQNAAGDTLFTSNTTNNRIKIGNDTATTGADTTALVLDTSTTANEPTGTNGAMYYNTSTNKFRCYESGAWSNCIGAGANTTLQNSYDNDTDTGDTIIALTAADDSLIFRNPAAAGSDSTYILTLDQLSTGAKGGLSIQNAGTGNLLLVTDTTATAKDVLTVADGGATTFRNQTDSTTAFQIQNAAGTTLLSADTTNLDLTVGGNLLVSKSSQTNQEWNKISGTAGTIGGNNSAINAIRSSVVYNGSLYVGTAKTNQAEIYRYDGNNVWTKVSQTTAGTIASAGTAAIDAVWALTVHNGSLYAGTEATETTGDAEIYRYDGGTTWTRVSFTAGQIDAGGTDNINSVNRLISYDGSLYAGTNESDAAEVYRYESGTDWTKVSGTTGTINGGTGTINTVASMTIHNGSLYVGTADQVVFAEIYRYENSVGSWTKISAATAGTIKTGGTTAVNGVYGLTSYNGSLYAGTTKTNDAEIYSYNNSVGDWTLVSDTTNGAIATGDTAAIDGLGDLTVYNGSLYGITYTTTGQGEVYRYNNAAGAWTKVSQTTAGTIASGGTASIDEIYTLTSFSGSLYAGTVESTAAEVYRYSDNILEARSSDTLSTFNISQTGYALFQNATDSTTAFQIQNAGGDSLVQVDSSNANITLNGLNSGEVLSWSTTTAMPTALDIHSTVVANGYMYIVGGRTAVGTSVATVSYAKINADGTVGSWSSTTSLPESRDSQSSVVANGYVYVLGGQSASTYKDSVYYAKLNSDGTIGTWNTTTVLPEARRLHSSVVANGYVYFIGGRNSGGTIKDTTYYAKLNANGTIGSWTATSTMPAARDAFGIATGNGYVYVTGGEENTTFNSTDTTYYAKLNADGTLGSWSSTSTMPAAVDSSYSVVANGYLYKLAGTTTPVYYAELNSDGTVGAWSTAANSLPDTRVDPTAVTVNGYFYVLGGRDGSNVRHTDVYYTSTSRILLGGSLDLIGLSGENLAEGGSGGSLTAGNTNIIGTFSVQDQANFNSSLYVRGNLTSNGYALFQNSTDSTAAFQIQNAASASLLNVDSTGSGSISLLGNNGGELKVLSGTNWNSTSALTQSRMFTASVIANGYIYRIAGSNSTGTAISADVEYAKLNADGSVGTWAATVSLPVNRDWHSAVYANGYIYVVGGSSTYDGGTPVTTVYYNRVNTDGTLGGTWTLDNDNTTFARQAADIGVSNGYIYLVGGSGSGGGQTVVDYAKLNADGSTGAWTATTALPADRKGPAVTIANGYIYALGGNTTSAQNNVYYAALDSSTGAVGTWQTNGTNQLNAARAYGHATVANGYIYYIGGWNTTTQSSVQYAALNANGSTGSWSASTTTLPAARDGYGIASANGYFYVVGGDNNSISNTTVYYASTARVTIGGNLDLVGLSGENLAEGGSGGTLAAGNTNIVGTLNVQDQANFASSLSVNKNLTISGYALFQNSTDSATAFQIQNAAGTSYLTVDTTNQGVTSGRLDVGTVTGNRIFSDNFESGNFNLWTTTGGTPTIDTATVFAGKYSEKVVTASSVQYVEKSITGGTTLYARGYFNFSSTGTNSNLFTLYNSPDGTAASEITAYRNNADGKITIWSGPAAGSCGTGGAAMSTGAWHKVELKVVISNTGSCQLWMDDNLEVNSGSVDTLATGNPNRVSVGTQSTGQTYTLFADEFAVDTQAIDNAGSANVQDTLHVGGSSIFGGAGLFQNASDSTNAFQIQNSTAGVLFTADTTNSKLIAGVDLIASAAPTASSVTQTYTSITDANAVGKYSSAAVGLDGFPIISYYDETGGDLAVLHCTNSLCTTNDTPTKISDAGGNTWGLWTSIAIGTDGFPVISHYNSSDLDLAITKCSNATCSSNSTAQFADGASEDVGSPNAIAIGRDGLPVIVTRNTTDTDLWVYQCTTTACSAVTSTAITSGNSQGNYNSIAIGSDGFPIIASRDLTAVDLIVTKCNNNSCSSNSTFTNTGDTGGFDTSIAITPDGLPIISYYNNGTQDLYTLKCGNTECTTGNTITQHTFGGENDGTWTTVRIGTDGLPVISSIDAGTAHDLSILKCGNDACSNDSTNDNTTFTTLTVGDFRGSMVVPPDGLPFITTFDDETSAGIDNLAVLKCADSSCSQSSATVGITGGINIGSMDKYFNSIYAANYYGKNYAVRNFDVAEEYPVEDQSLVAGEIVSLNPATGKLKRASATDRNNLLGIISTNPGLALRDYEANRTDTRLVALIGRVPLKVKGPIVAGDSITISSEDGVGIKAATPGLIVGRALESTDTDGTISVFVSTSYYTPSMADTLQGDMLNSDLMIQGGLTVSADINVSGTANLNLLTVSGDANFRGNVVIAGTLKAQNIEISGHIVTAGDTPQIEILPAAGQEATVTVEGNDVSGTIHLTSGTNQVQPGDMAKLIFKKVYSKTPKVFIEAANPDAISVQIYRDVTPDHFVIKILNQLDPSKTYIFDYFVVE